mgnify:CR=1 FL=1
MKNFEGLKQNLESYLRKWYLLRMLRGLALFLGFFFCYFLLVTFTEYFLYLTEGQRKTIFFIGVFLAIVGSSYYFIYPLLQILKLARRSTYSEVAKMIGQKISGVDDKILNTLQLGESLDNKQSDLISAAIEQKAEELSFYNFKDTLSWKSLSRVALFLSLPLSLIFILSLSTQGRLVLGSSERLLRYNDDFTPPAPFQFVPEKYEYWVEYGEDLDLRLDIVGAKQPTELRAFLNGSEYRLTKVEDAWLLTLENITDNYDLQYEAMGYRSQTISIKTFKSPRIGLLELIVDPPSYTGLKQKKLPYSQNIKVLRGSDIALRFQLENTDKAVFISDKDSLEIEKGKLDFRLEESLNYSIALENGFNKSQFFNHSKIEAVADKAPEIHASYRFVDEDSTKLVVTIRAKDDFGLSSLRRVQKLGEEETELRVQANSLSYYEEIIDLEGLQGGKDFTMYYRIADNNTLYGPSWARSESFSLRLLSTQEKKAKQAKSESATMESFEELKKSREALSESLKDLENKKSKKQDWREEEKLKDLLKELEAKQKENKERRKDLEKLVEKDLAKKEELKEQLKVLSETEKKIEELRKEIEELLSKNDKEQLQEKLKQLQEENKEQLRREQRLEDLLKDLLFQRDMLRTIEDYKELSEELKSEENEEKSAEDSEKKAEELEKKLEELAKDSKELSEMLEKEEFKTESEELKQNLKDAKEAEKSQEQGDSKESKDKAGDNASEMSESLAMMMEGMQAKALSMNMQALRRILENLERYSVDVEAYKEGVSELEKGDPAFRGLLKKGSVLSANSKVISDSLIALSEKAPEIKDKVFKDLNEMQYQLGSAQGHLQEVELMKAASSGQFSMMSANDLALLLDDAMQNMMSMMASKKKGDQNCEKPGNGKPKPGSMSEKLGKMGKMVEKLEKGSQPGNKGMGPDGKSIGQVLSEQESLRQTLQEMDKEGGKENGNGKPLDKELDEMEDLLLNENFSEYIERFKRVETRLLESEKANMERKQKEERMSKSAEELEMQNGKEADLLKTKEIDQKDILRLSPLLLNPFYQK